MQKNKLFKSTLPPKYYSRNYEEHQAVVGKFNVVEPNEELDKNLFPDDRVIASWINR